MLIAIDFDDTLTADAEMWKLIIPVMKSRDHRVVCVTQRRASEENVDLIDDWMAEHDLVLPTYFTNGEPKESYMLRMSSIRVDIWVDDNINRAVHGV